MVRVIPESRLRERRRKQRMLRIAVVCGLLLLIFGVLVGLSRASFLRINSVVVSGASDALAAQVQARVAAQLAGSYGYVFARDNIFLYPKAAITKDLLAHFPELRSVTVEGSSWHALSVAVAERAPVALWCGAGDAVSDSSSIFANQNCFLLDKNGLVYAPAPDAPSSLQKYFGAATSTTTGSDLPKQYLTPAQFASLAAFVSALAGKVPGDTVASVRVDDANNARVAFISGFELRFLLSDNAGDVLQHFALAQTASIFKTHQLSDFLYLDLRFGEKIYYKLKNQ